MNRYSIQYRLTPAQLVQLRKACDYMRLDWRAQAARPAIARSLITRYERIVAENKEGAA